MKGKDEKELDGMLGEGIIEPVESEEWAAPIVSLSNEAR